MTGAFWVHVTCPVNAVQAGQVHRAIVSPRRKGKPPRRTHTTACGLQRARLLAIPVVDPDGTDRGAMTTKWPPRVDEIAAEGLTRCPRCYAISPGKPQRLNDGSGLRPL